MSIFLRGATSLSMASILVGSVLTVASANAPGPSQDFIHARAKHFTVAGSLQVHHRARLVGTTTFGKGSVQQDFVLSDGADIHLTVERWYLPNGQTIDHKGLQPDITATLANPTDAFDVASPAQGYAKDTQLNTALSSLAG